MRGLVASELLKLRTTRATYGLLVAVFVFSGLAVAGAVGSDSLESGQAAIDVADAAEISGILALVLGIVIVTNEYRHGTATPTFLVTPARERVVAAKLIAAALAGLALGLAVAVLAYAIALPWQASRDEPLAAGDVTVAVLRLVAAFAFSTVLGVAIGAIVRSQIGAIAGTFAWLLVLGPLVSVLTQLVTDTDERVRLLPGSALDALVSSDRSLLSSPSAFALVIGYVAVLATAATILTVRRDAD